jgi:hypothetical protein
MCAGSRWACRSGQAEGRRRVPLQPAQCRPPGAGGS